MLTSISFGLPILPSDFTSSLAATMAISISESSSLLSSSIVSSELLSFSAILSGTAVASSYIFFNFSKSKLTAEEALRRKSKSF